MTRDEELAQLIEEQRRDDTHMQRPEVHLGLSFISLDAEFGSETHSGGLPALREDYLAGEVYDFDAMIEEGDPEAPGEIVGFFDPRPSRGFALRQIEHGTYNGYNNRGCRCPRCTRANSDYMAVLAQKRRKREQDARPDRICLNQKCGKAFRPVPSTKLYCSYRCADATSKRRQRANAKLLVAA